MKSLTKMHIFDSISAFFRTRSHAGTPIQDQNTVFSDQVTRWNTHSGPEYRVFGPHHVLEHLLKTGITGFGASSRAGASLQDRNYGFWGLITCWSISSGPELRVFGLGAVLEHPLKTGIAGLGSWSRAGASVEDRNYGFWGLTACGQLYGPGKIIIFVKNYGQGQNQSMRGPFGRRGLFCCSVSSEAGGV